MAKRHSNEHYIVAIDIGSSKIVVLFAEEGAGGRLEIFGQAQGRSAGVRRGQIVDIEATSMAVRAVAEKAYLSCNTNIGGATINISDPNLRVFNLTTNTHMDNSGRVKEADVKRVIKTAESVKIAKAERHISSVTQHYILDKDPHTGQGVVVRQPIGEEAEMLEVNMHIVVASEQGVKNIESSIELNDIKVLHVVPSSMASSEPYLTQDQKDDGVCLVDIGSGVMDLSVFKNGSIVHSEVIQRGAESVTSDIADAFNTTFEEAERLKLKYGQAQITLPGEDKLIEFQQVNDINDYYLSHQSLIKVIELAYLDLFKLIRNRLNNGKYYRSLKEGFVLVGGGVKIENCDKLMSGLFKKKVRIGHVNTGLIRVNTNSVSSNDDLLAPEYACALGLLLFENDEHGLKERQSVNKAGFIKKLKLKF
ncbi:cell division protein FtsA [Bathymodiolus septemdierum thioautotrophic gill symbiont]|uniref:Cell division protein FtsA n=1 Tax=endosymbiont of Bathymodiolus septemdierum str. Myojin knoll TaxID=1303921 RepID=A0A0P0UR46_9GAMM|nr:cell division protein FtsA [Bathymodiolus septemdierum thioautotrophic gill symbiont]BAS67570.1 cell division protein FtsA [endosymbiont of Bathymodiolus septemdierum str. Myojin knoll]